MIYLELFFGFLRVGCFSFGGAYGAIPLIRDVTLSRGWLDEEALTRMIAVAESTPGSIMVNLATYTGSSMAGFAGALVATLAVVLPAFAIILLVTAVLKTLLKNKYVQAALEGLKPCITGMIAATGAYMIICSCIKTGEAGQPDLQAVFITALLLAAAFLSKPLLKKKLSPVALIGISALLGIAVYAV